MHRNAAILSPRRLKLITILNTISARNSADKNQSASIPSPRSVAVSWRSIAFCPLRAKISARFSALIVAYGYSSRLAFLAANSVRRRVFHPSRAAISRPERMKKTGT